MVTQKSLYSREVKLFLTKVMAQRNYLIKSKKGFKNELEMRQAIDTIMPYNYMDFSEKGAAKFILKHQHTLHRMIPGHLSNMKRTLNELVTKASMI